MKLVRAWLTLVLFSFRQLFWSASTLMVCAAVLACGLFVLRRDYAAMPDTHGALVHFTQEVLIGLLASFFIPVCALAYGAGGLAADREEGALVFLLMRPIPRAWMVLAKLAAAAPLVVGLCVASFWVYCWQAGSAGRTAWQLFLPAVFYMAIAYTGLFHLLAVVFRHGTILGMIYALFVEGLLGNMPGIVKRMAINFYGRSIIFDVGAYEGIPGPSAAWFVPVTAQHAARVLVAVFAITVLAAMVVFARREYRDLS